MFHRLLGWGSSSASPQASGSNTRSKEVHSLFQVNDYLYELYKPEGTPTLQIIFFHGLRSGDLSDAHVSTWKSEDDSCIWPQEWLPDIFPGAHIFTVSYSASAKVFDMHLLGENLVSDLLEGGIGQITSCPVILVGHCVGGLVIKEICCQAHDQLKLHSSRAPIKKKQLKMFLGNVRGMFYYSTPHHGSSIVAKATEGPLFQFFRILNEHAERLNFKFEGVQPEYKWLIFGLGECLPTTSSQHNYSNVVVVPEASSRHGDNFLIVEADHNSICQPKSKIDKRFSLLKNLIDTIAIELEEEAQVRQDTNLPGAQHQDFEQAAVVLNPSTIIHNKLRMIDDEEGAVASLVKCLALSDNPALQESVLANTLANLADTHPISWTIANEEVVLDALAKLLVADNKPELQISAARALQNLSATKDHDLQLCIANKEGVVAGLGKCLALYGRPGLQERVAHTFANLALTGRMSWTIANEVGVLDALAKLLLADNKPEVQIAAARALQNLSATKDKDLKLAIANKEGVVAGLGHCLAFYDRPGLQQRVASTLANLALTGRMSWTIANEVGVLNVLAKLLLADNKPEVQTAAARALENLSATKDKDLKLSIANKEGVVAGLGHCLAFYDHPGLQERVANTLANLADTHPISWTIAQEEVVVNALAKLLLADNKPELQISAARALHNVSAMKDNDLKFRVANKEGVVAGLGKCLALYGRPGLQETVAHTLANLALTGRMSWTIANEVGVLDALAKLLLADNMPEVQIAAVRALQNLSATKDKDLKLSIANKEGVVAGLGHCLAFYDRPGLQQRVASTLANLAFTGRMSWTIAHEEGVLNALAKLLLVDNKPELQRAAARALENLTATKDKDLKLRIANQRGVVAALVKCQALNERPHLQELVAKTLANLAHTDQSGGP